MKSLLNNSIYYIAYRLINVIYPLITATYVSRVLGPAGVGEAALAQSIVIFLVAVALLGIPNYGVREVSRASEKEINSLFTELFLINFVSTAIIAAAYYIVISLPVFRLNRTLYIIYGIIILQNVINVDWFYQGKEEFKYITIRSAVVKLLSVCAIFTFVRKESDLYVYGLIFTLAYVGNYTFNAINLRKYVKISLKDIHIKRHLKSVFTLAITAISNEIYVTLDMVMLGIFSTSAEVGYYSNSMKLMRILINVVTALGTVMLPRLSKLRNEQNQQAYNSIINKVINILLWITIPCTIGILLIPEQIVVVLFGDEFLPASGILAMLSFLIVPRAFSNMSLQVLVCTKNDEKTSKVYFSGMLLNAFLNSIFIQFWGAYGAAIASVVSEAYICVVLLHYSKKMFAYISNKRFLAGIAVSAALMILAVVIWKKTFLKIGMPQFMILMCCLATGVITYCGISFLLKNEITLFAISKVKRLLHK